MPEGDATTSFIREAIETLLSPLGYLVDPSRRIHVLFLLTSLLLAVAVAASRKRSFRTQVRAALSLRYWWSESARLDYKILFANGVLRNVLFAPLVAGTLTGAMGVAAVLQVGFGEPPELRWSAAAVATIYTVSLFVIDDLSRYLLHRAMHRVPRLWELHKLHHSAEVLTPMTLYRVHPLESFLSALRNAVVSALVVGVCFYFFRGQLSLVELLGVNAVGFVLTAAGSNLRHSHVPLSFGKHLEFLFVSPVQHQIHHSRSPEHHDKNFGSLLAIWDWVSGTLVRAEQVPESQRAALRFGVDRRDGQGPELFRGLGEAYLAPLRNMLHRTKVTPGARGLAAFLIGTFIGVGAARAKEPVVEAKQASEPGQSDETTAPADKPSASDESSAATMPAYELGAMSILGREDEVARVAGSAHVVSEEQLEEFEDDDAHRALTRVPGVYVRGEDGYGLRPNIGMRGAISDRSKKVTLLEDGILLGPAPYSAPAAYYFPLLTRMTSLEVFKGPAAIQHGPQTIGGAINLTSRATPAFGHRVGVDMAYGNNAYGKWHGYYGYGSDRAGVLIEAVRLRSDGFKRLEVPAGRDNETGFEKTEVMAKARVSSNPDARVFHEGRFKFGFTYEHSKETYLGLTDADFELDPYRRYAASQLDRMKNHRWLGEARYRFAIDKLIDVDLALYRHQFTRSWFKLNGFRSGTSLGSILADPEGGAREIYFGVLTGAEDSSSSGETLLVGDNHRTYISQGAQVSGSLWLPQLGPVEQKVRFGVRLHQDEIRREHTEDSFLMRSGLLVSDGAEQALNTNNLGHALATAVHVVDEIQIGPVLLTPGIRFEHIRTRFENFKLATVEEQVQNVFLPGVGALYSVGHGLAAVAGVYQGFSPVAPGQTGAVKPELSVNYEAGLRFSRDNLAAEAVGFYNDYSNITGECTFSSGCAAELLDKQFDGGAARIAGVETNISHRFDWPELSVPLRATYTFTHTELLTSFQSANPLFGIVEKGDEMPYVPRHQASITGGVHMRFGGLNLSGTYVGAMREQAGSEPYDEVMSTDEHLIVDALLYVRPIKHTEVYLKLDNVLDHAYIASHRPYGARPGRPRFTQVGLRVEM